MRRLIDFIYERLLGIRIKTAEQHAEDLRKMLNDLCETRDSLEAEIEHTARQLTEANLRLVDMKRRGN